MPTDDKQDRKKHDDQAEKEEAVTDATDQVDSVVEQEVKQGFRGVEVDMTPNENYTVQGVTSGADVPEAHANKVEASLAATNPDLVNPH
jgi:hypothetical protein